VVGQHWLASSDRLTVCRYWRWRVHQNADDGRTGAVSMPSVKLITSARMYCDHACSLVRSFVRSCRIDRLLYKPVGDWISAPSPNFHDPQVTDYGWRNDPQTYRRFCAKFGEWIFGVRDLIQTFCRGGLGELTAKKWLDSIKKQKRRINLKFVRHKQTDGQAVRQSQRQKNNRLLG